jgi:hypothetical protein
MINILLTVAALAVLKGSFLKLFVSTEGPVNAVERNK